MWTCPNCDILIPDTKNDCFSCGFVRPVDSDVTVVNEPKSKRLNLFKGFPLPHLLNCNKKEYSHIEAFYLRGVEYYKDNFRSLRIVNPDYYCAPDAIMSYGTPEKPVYENFLRFGEARLVPEPKNNHDKNAIKVMYKRILLGYIPAESCVDVKKIIPKSKTIFTILGGKYKLYEPDGSYLEGESSIRVKIKIYCP